VPTTAPEITEEPGGSRSRKGAQTRARLVAAAKQVFEEDGFLDARISDIAERAGLAHGSFYTYFESKEEIFREVALEVEERLSAPLGDVILAPSSHATPHERIREAIRRHLESYREEARIMGVIEQVSRHDDLLNAARRERHDRYKKLVADSIGQLQRHGLADPRLDPTIASAVLGSMTNRFPEMWLTQGLVNCSFEDGVEHLTMIYTNALQLRDPSDRQGTGHRPAGTSGVDDPGRRP
jgi:AcrR family transcriptional regulator